MNINTWIFTSSLDREIQRMEKQLHMREYILSEHSSLLKSSLLSQLTSPKMILISAGFGFAAGYVIFQKNNIPSNKSTVHSQFSFVLSITRVIVMIGSMMAIF